MWIFFTTFIVVVSLIYTFVGWRLIRPSRLTRPRKRIAWLGLYSVLGVFLAMVFLHIGDVETFWADALAWIAFVSFGAVLVLFTLLAIRDLLGLAALGVRKSLTFVNRASPSQESSGNPFDPSRRRFLVQSSNLGIVVLSGGLTGYGLYEARKRPDIVSVEVPLPNLPVEFDGFRIVQITDIHAGPTIKRGWIEEVANTVNSLNPDLVAVTGDLVDGTAQYLRDDVAPIGDLRAPYGVYFVTGNHEYYSGVMPWLREVERLGLKVLLNRHVILERGRKHMVLAGVTDYMADSSIPGHKSDPKAALAGAPTASPRILLAHQPRSIYAASEAGYDLQISGHTHGGQFFPGSVLARLAQPYISGLHKHDNTHIYVSRGTGYWGPPIRVGQPSEITEIKLVHAYAAG